MTPQQAALMEAYAAVITRGNAMTDPVAVLHCVRTHLGYMDNEVDQINRLMNRIRFEPLQGWNASLAESVVAKLRQVADDLEGLGKEEVREAAE